MPKNSDVKDLENLIDEWSQGLVADASLDDIMPLSLVAIGVDAYDGMDEYVEAAIEISGALDPTTIAKGEDREKIATMLIDEMRDRLLKQVKKAAKEEARMNAYLDICEADATLTSR